MKQTNPSLRKSFQKHAMPGQRTGYNRMFAKDQFKYNSPGAMPFRVFIGRTKT